MFPSKKILIGFLCSTLCISSVFAANQLIILTTPEGDLLEPIGVEFGATCQIPENNTIRYYLTIDNMEQFDEESELDEISFLAVFPEGIEPTDADLESFYGEPFQSPEIGKRYENRKQVTVAIYDLAIMGTATDSHNIFNLDVIYPELGESTELEILLDAQFKGSPATSFNVETLMVTIPDLDTCSGETNSSSSSSSSSEISSSSSSSDSSSNSDSSSESSASSSSSQSSNSDPKSPGRNLDTEDTSSSPSSLRPAGDEISDNEEQSEICYLIPDDSAYTIAIEFPDVDEVSDMWPTIPVGILKNCSIVHGDTDGNYWPWRNLSRIEMIKIALGSAVLKQEKFDIEQDLEIPFPDVEPDTWYYDYVATAYKHGVVDGYNDGLFRPFDMVSRQEALKIILGMFGFEADSYEVDELPFPDATEGHWSYPYIGFSKTYNIITGFEDGDFKPVNNITRAEMAKVMTNILRDVEFSDDSVAVTEYRPDSAGKVLGASVENDLVTVVEEYSRSKASSVE